MGRPGWHEKAGRPQPPNSSESGELQHVLQHRGVSFSNTISERPWCLSSRARKPSSHVVPLQDRIRTAWNRNSRGLVLGEIATSLGHDRIEVRVWQHVGRVWQAPSSRQIADTGTRENLGQGVQRGWGHGAMQHQTAQYECWPLPWTNVPSVAPRRAICSGHHPEERSQC